jgi:hypothetical protein
LSLETLTSGAVIQYQFLWSWQHARGETEGRKARPTVVGFRVKIDMLLLFPITTKEPEEGSFFVEVPDHEKRGAGLDELRKSWIVLDEVNIDFVSRSSYLSPDCELGRFSRNFVLKVFRAWVSEREGRDIHMTPRLE